MKLAGSGSSAGLMVPMLFALGFLLGMFAVCEGLQCVEKDGTIDENAHPDVVCYYGECDNGHILRGSYLQSTGKDACKEKVANTCKANMWGEMKEDSCYTCKEEKCNEKPKEKKPEEEKSVEETTITPENTGEEGTTTTTPPVPTTTTPRRTTTAKKVASAGSTGKPKPSEDPEPGDGEGSGVGGQHMSSWMAIGGAILAMVLLKGGA